MILRLAYPVGGASGGERGRGHPGELRDGARGLDAPGRACPEALHRRQGDGAGGMILRLAHPTCRPWSRTAAGTMERAA